VTILALLLVSTIRVITYVFRVIARLPALSPAPNLKQYDLFRR